MLLPAPPLKPRKPKGKANPPPARTANRIVSVTQGDSPDQIRVTLTTTLTGFDDIPDMFAVSADGVDWVYPNDFEGMENIVTFSFALSVTTKTQWRIPGPGNWHFADAQPLVEPHSGTIG